LYCSKMIQFFIWLKYGFGPCKYALFCFFSCKKNCCFWSLQICLVLILVSHFTFVMICTRGTWWLNPFMRKIVLQNLLIFKKVPAKYFGFEISPFKDYFQKQYFAGTKNNNFFFTETKTKTRHICRDQNHILDFLSWEKMVKVKSQQTKGETVRVSHLFRFIIILK